MSKKKKDIFGGVDYTGDPNNKQCIAISESTGKRCRRKASPGSDYCGLGSHCENPEDNLPEKQQHFVDEYCKHYNATRAAKIAGYSENSADAIGCELLKHPHVKKAIKKRLNELAMSREEAIKRMADWGRGSPAPFLSVDPKTQELKISLSSPEAKEHLHLIKKIKQYETTTENGITRRTWEIELHDAKDAVDKILKIHGAYAPDKIEDVTPQPKRLVLIEKKSDRDG